MNFSYKALAADGKTVSGSAEAADRDGLIALLARQKLHPIVIHAEKGKGGLHFSLLKPKVRLTDLVIFTRQLSTMISAGVPLVKALDTLALDTDSKYLRTIIAGVTKDVESGLPLATAFAKYPNAFSRVYINMVKAGESGGILDEILKRLATQVEQDASIKKKIRSAMAYPTVIFVVTIIAFFGIMIFIMPKISSILTGLAGPNAKLPIYTRVLLDISKVMQHYALYIILGTIALIFFTVRYIRTPKGRYQFHYLLLRAPIFKIVVTKIAVARFSRTFASLMSAGVSVLDALDVTGGAVGNLVIEGELKKASEAVRNGRPLSEPLGDSKYFPPIVSQMLSVGEETGQIDTVLVKVADFYDEEVAAVINSLASIIEPVMIVVLGGVVGLIAASVMGPIASLSKNVANQ
ncbi:MAG TPA: type II secretion system F family protein [Candidatus Saccharimonadales bacterium]|jgi:type IV pilus assembly protein PilC|nr:type II secretion system F family protein [Candidatus Saccharimonadales bacterium]